MGGFDVVGLSEPLKEIVLAVRSAVGGWYQPRQIRLLADANAYASKREAETNLEISRMNVGEVTSLASRAQSRLEHQAQKEQENIENILDEAVKLVDVTSFSHHKNNIDNDKINRIVNESKLFSKIDLQSYWSFLLAKELGNPGSISSRTIEIVKNLESWEAKMFQDVCKYTVKIHNNIGIAGIGESKNHMLPNLIIGKHSESLIEHFSSIGVLRSKVDMKLASFKSNAVIRIMFGNRLVSCRVNDDSSGKNLIAYVPFTLSGKEIYSTLSSRATDDDLRVFCDALVKRGATNIHHQ